jgi:hypothetical protein
MALPFIVQYKNIDHGKTGETIFGWFMSPIAYFILTQLH